MKRNTVFSKKALSALLALLCIPALVACSAQSASKSAMAVSTSASSSTAMSQTTAGFEGSAELDQSLMESGEMASPKSAPSPNPEPATTETRKLVKHVNLSLETKDFDKAVSELLLLVETLGGYVENQSVDGRSLEGEHYYSRAASIQARIPVARLDESVSQVGTLCNIVSKNENTENITDRYYDDEAHLKSLRLQEERLLEILSKAEKLEEVITLEQALSDTRYEIERLTASLRRMDSQVAYSFLNMELREVMDYQTPTSAPKTYGERLLAAAGRSVDGLVSSLQEVSLVLVENGLLVLFWGGLFVGVVFLILRVILRPRSKKSAHPAPEQPNSTEPVESKEEKME